MKKILCILSFLYISGCATTETRYVDLTDRIPVNTGESAASLLGQCVTGLESGYAKIGICEGDLGGFFSSPLPSISNTHDVGLKKLSLNVGYDQITLGGKTSWYTEYVTESTVQLKPKSGQVLNEEEIEQLYESCNIDNDDLFIQKVFIGCSTVDHVLDIEQLNADYIKKYVDIGGKYKAEKTIGVPKNFTIGLKSEDTPSCSTNGVIHVKAIQASSICNRLSAQRAITLKRKVVELRKELMDKTYEIRELITKLNNEESNLSSLNNMYEECRTVKDTLISKAGKGNVVIAALKADLDKQKIHYVYLDEKLKNKESTLLDCKLDVNSKTQKVETLSNTLNEKNEVILANNAKHDRSLSAIEKKIASKEAEINGYKDTIKNMSTEMARVKSEYTDYQNLIAQNTITPSNNK